jgi:hypothetical protein
MQKIKLFKSIESELASLESEINEWIKTTGVKVISISGNIAPQSLSSGGTLGSFSASDVLLIVMYEDGNAR